MDPTDDLILGEPETLEWLSRCQFAPPGTAVRCGVSGGADSVALLLLAVAAGLEVTAVHVDHQLRPAGDSEAEFVRSQAHRFGASFETHRVDVREGPNLEERARIARRAVLGPGALTGHTADDQAETVLLNLLRGAGVDGLAAMRPGQNKPLLGLRRSDTEAVCNAFGVEWLTDSTNFDPRFRRNRVRHELVPLMNTIADRDVVPLLDRTANSARDSGDALEQLLPGGDPSDTRWLAGLPAAQVRLIVRSWLHRRIGRPVSADATARAMAVVHHEAIGADIIDGWHLRRHDGQLEMEQRR